MPTFTEGNDTYLVHTAGAFDLDFLGGDDTLTVQGGDSTTAHMGTGNDIVQLKSGLATVFGDAGTDRFEIYAANATVDGGDDNDLINIRAGSGITASGGLGDDRFNFYGDASNVNLFGNDGNDDFFGYYHSLTGAIVGGAGNDYFVQFTNGVILYGGDGSDIYRATVGNSATFSESVSEGIDSVQVARGQNYILPVNIENISVQGFSGSTLGAVSVLWGNTLNNTIVAHNNVESIEGFDGNDRISAKGGDDTLKGDAGDDYLDGGSGNDMIFGGNGNDTLQGRAGNDAMTGGDGNDTYYIDSLSDVVTEQFGEGIDHARVSIDNYTLADFVENGTISSGVGGLTLNGNALANLLTGSAGNDTLNGVDGNDTLKGGAGNDTLAGGNDNDVLNGGTGDDAMNGGAGNDTYYVDSASDTVTESFGTDTVYSSVASFTLPSAVENGTILLASGARLDGNSLDNSLTGGDGNDSLYAVAGADTLFGGGGDDYLDGGSGSASIDGGSGADFIVTTFCNATIVYGTVSDSPAPEGALTDITYDRIGWAGLGDTIDFSAIDADTTAVGDQAFTLVGSPTGAAGEMWSVYDSGTMLNYFFGDVDGGGADFVVAVSAPNLADVSFVF
jgi:Ca2+-binding RTX toxin-like protein